MTTTSQGNSKQILVGAAAVYISGTQAALPDLTAVTTSATVALDSATGWAHTGYTDGGIEVQYEPTYGDVTVDQLLDSAVIYKTGMKVLVNTTFSEATLENLLITWGSADSDLTTNADGYKTLDINAGALGSFPHERGVAFVGPGPRTASAGKSVERIYHVERAIQTSNTNHSLKRDAATTLPVSFRCLPGGVSGTSTSYGTVQDRAYTAS